MGALGEYRVGHNHTGHVHWIECRSEVVAVVEGPTSGSRETIVWHYQGEDRAASVRSIIPTWEFEGTYPSVGHCLVALARSHRRFVEPHPAKRLWRGMALWPAWGKVAAVVIGLAALSEVLSYWVPNGGAQLIGWVAG